jgi:hypothetical protein
VFFLGKKSNEEICILENSEKYKENVDIQSGMGYNDVKICGG